MQNKRGDVNWVIITLALGILVLVVLALAFTGAWKSLAFWIPKNNVQTIVTQCSIACSMQNKYDFCTKKRELRAENETLPDVTCFELASLHSEYGIEECPDITSCPAS